MSASRPFAHLHCHTHYSLLDGATRIDQYIKKVKDHGMTAAAVTDHGNLYGALEFYLACKSAGVNPILGMEAYIAPGSRFVKSGATKTKEASFHLTLLAINRQGFQNLVKMSSRAFLEGFYYKPRIDKELLEACNEGLICLSGCAAGELSFLLLGEQLEEAEKLAAWYSRVFGDRFYLEIQNAGFEIQTRCAERTIDLARKMGLPLVATNDAHYLNREDAAVQDVLLCVNTKSERSDTNRMRMDSDQLFIRTPDEMYAAFPGLEDAVARSQEIANRADIDLDLKSRHFPVFVTPDNKADIDYLRELCEQGMIWRYGADGITQAHRDRLTFELNVIQKMGYASYFLIVWDFVRFAMERGIPCSARGSACGAIVAYVLGLSHVCPLEYDLLFERFLDPSRTEPPDIDIDFCRDRRQDVIDYTKQKYGEQNVSQIGTFGTLKAKAAIRDVGRALSVPLKRVDEVAKMVPDELNIELKEAIEKSADLKEAYNTDPQIQELLNMAIQLEGLARSAGTHAAGVVVSDRPIEEYVPLQTISGKTDVVTQWEGPTVEKAGMLKMDFLGLRNLTILDKAVKNVKKHRGKDIDPVKLPLDDAPTFALLQRGETKGIFQLESGGMRDLLTKMKPDKFADIIATSALYRPGPLEGGMVMTYVDVKHGRQPLPRVHPIMDGVLDETYGVMVYQEQVMRILNRLGGIELSQSYQCIKAISKKKLETIAKYRAQFLEGAQKNGLPEQTAVELFGMIEKFAGYGFNKCVVGETVVMDARSGKRSTIGELFERGVRRSRILALDEHGKLVPRTVTDVVWNGRRRVYRLTTALGRELVATGNHPLRTWGGWTDLSALRIGDRVAAPRRCVIAAGKRWPAHEIITLAHLLAEGNLCHPTCLYFFNNSLDAIDDFQQAVQAFPNSVGRVTSRHQGRRHEVCVSTGRDTRFQRGQKPWNADAGGVKLAHASRSGAYRWAEQLGILGAKANAKSVPAAVFELADADLELFLGRLWSGDGYIGRGGQSPFYATSSKQLARDVQDLLLRLGVVSRLRTVEFKYRHRGEISLRTGFTVHLIGEDSLAAFVRRILPHVVGRETDVDTLTAYAAAQSPGRSSKDTLPADVRRWVDEERREAGLTWRELEQQSGVSIRELCRVASSGKRGFRRVTIGRLATFFESNRLKAAAESDLYWDTVVAIEPVGIRDTYDLTVAGDHNFVADGLIVHNSHSTAYGAVAYQTAYLKAHYPVEFMAALLSCELGETDKLTEHLDDCRRMKIEVLPPDINRSEVEFTCHGDKIAFGLGAIKGVGEGAVGAMVAERQANGPFTSIYDLTERVDPKQVTKGVLELLVKAGAFDSLGGRRAQQFAVVERAVQGAANMHRDRQRGQKSLFGGDDEPAEAAAASMQGLPEMPEWSHREKLNFEKEALGFYLTSHPLTEVSKQLDAFASNPISDLVNLEDGVEVVLGGMISAIKKAQTKKPSRNGHSKYVNFDFEDPSGVVRCIMWPEEFARLSEKVVGDEVRFLKGKVDKRSREPNVIVNAMWTLDEAERDFTRQVAIKFHKGLHDERVVNRVRDILQRYPGKSEVVVLVETVNSDEPTNRLRFIAQKPLAMKVSASRDLQTELNDVLGEGYLHLFADTKRASSKPQSVGR
ncbi:MAG: DNA polymerase III subunit alpha [Planctomycetaceae bacterium]|nr:DNA polymerase III subunit alpha [Planctomycetaceae bacterium]